MKRTIITILVFIIYLGSFAQKPHYPEKGKKDLTWFQEAKFGMFIHWGLYSILAGEFEGKEIPGIGEWAYKRANLPTDKYEALVKEFNPIKFEAEQWAKTAKDAGMKYLLITTKHHDGFSLFDSKVTKYDIMSSPYKKDIIKELQLACKKHDVKLCLYYSIIDWHHKDVSYRHRDSKQDFSNYVQNYMKPQLKELLSGDYGEIGMVWFDGFWESWWTADMGKDVYDYIYKMNPNIIINDRLGKPKNIIGDYITPEQNIPAIPTSTLKEDDCWETVLTMNNTWGYKKNDDNWKSPREIIRTLIEIASRGGNLTLNVGPTGEGLIPEGSTDVLKKVGQWMQVNGEAIYGTSASPIGMMPWGRITVQGEKKMFLHIFEYPRKELNIRLDHWKRKKVKSVRLLSKPKQQLENWRVGIELRLNLPAHCPDEIATVIEVEFE
ncbi:alpha-L-fucosidase [Tamlana sp. 2201CG12-4]|uniref:alpha-L-fucosidase n=1 Tax=Tamlana sp. 2201CG12-4 TaxID=3112582 RepID=UPI002DB949E2|nr:alpha-L-fucosidase [Tamlana sp. 2201CG12-4]MEC3908799.1 alpha-L-fucosidase [Tamlana sp. 2201CG12-4]